MNLQQTMTDFDVQLHDYESEDISDIVVKLEKSFGIKFDKNAFINIKTFGDLCDVIESYIKYNNKNDCTKQQAFYKIRLAISETQLIDKTLITPDSQLADLFPLYNRRTQVKIFEKQMGIDLKLLTYPDWLAQVLLTVLLASLITFFFDWKMAVSGIIVFIVAQYVAAKAGRNLQFKTVKELTEKAATEHYITVRRTKLTVNKNEILATIQQAFCDELWLKKDQLRSDTKFKWA